MRRTTSLILRGFQMYQLIAQYQAFNSSPLPSPNAAAATHYFSTLPVYTRGCFVSSCLHDGDQPCHIQTIFTLAQLLACWETFDLGYRCADGSCRCDYSWNSLMHYLNRDKGVGIINTFFAVLIRLLDAESRLFRC